MSPSTDEPVLEHTGPGAPELRFVAPILGLDHLRRFVLVELDEQSPLFSLQSLDDAGTRLLVLPPQAFLTDYDPAFDGVSLAALGLGSSAEGLLLVVVTPGASAAESTANLLAPILLNPVTGAAAQVVLTGSEYPLRFPLTA